MQITESPDLPHNQCVTQMSPLRIILSLCLPMLLQEFDIDTERLPLGTLSKHQVQRGYDVLERLRSALNGSGESLERLSSEFYQVPPVFCHFNDLASP